MPITRSVWIDDDGSGTTGTVLNNSELQEIYNNIDALHGTSNTQTILSTTTGTAHDWTIPGLTGKNTLIDWVGAAPLTVTGIAGGVNGQLLTIRNRSGQLLTFAHYNAGSLEQNKLINFVGSAPTPLSLYGTAQWIYLNNFWHLIAHEQGAWITVPFSAANYTNQGAVTAGMVKRHDYRLSGRTLTVSVDIEGVPASSVVNFIITGQLFTPAIPTTFLMPGISTINGGGTGPCQSQILVDGRLVFTRNDGGAISGGPHQYHLTATYPVN